MNNIKFNTIDEVIENDYLVDYIATKDEIEYYYNDYTGKKLLCMRIKGTIGMNIFRTYNINKQGQFLKY